MEIKPAIAYFDIWLKRNLARTGVPELPILSLPSLNKKIFGIPVGKMTVIGARTSMGKTTLAMQIMMDLVSIGAPVIYLGFEMKPDEMLDRMFCNRYKIDNFELLKGKMQDYQTEYEDYQKWLKGLRLVFADNFARSWTELDTFLQTLPTKPKVVVLDFIQAIAHNNAQDKRFIDDYILNFRQLAVREDFAGIIVSQINRTNPDAKNKEPQMHQLKGSGFLEEHADMVLLLDWKDKDKPDFEINVAKYRSGPTGWVKVDYEPQYYRFKERETTAKQDLKEQGYNVDFNA